MGKADSYDSGVLDKDEVREAVNKLFEQSGRPPLSSRLFDMYFDDIDVNDDEEVELLEFRELVRHALEAGIDISGSSKSKSNAKSKSKSKAKKATPEEILENPLRLKKAAKEAFKKYDRDGSGHLDREELASAANRACSKLGLEELESSEFDDLWDNVNVDHDDAISQREFRKF